MKNYSAATAQMTVGLDVGDRFSYLYILRDDGELVEEGRVPTTREALETRFRAMAASQVALETGAHSPWVSRLLEDCGHKVIVANPRQLPLIYRSPKKSDRLDAEQLARLARIDQTLLSPVQHRSRVTQAQLAILKSRDALVRARTRLILHVRGTTKSFGTRLPACSAESFHNQAMALLPGEAKPGLQAVVQTIGSLTKAIRRYDKAIRIACKESFPQAQRLSQVAGVGDVIALAFVLTIEDPRRFRNSRSIGPYLGLVPKRDDSGERSPQLRITKHGDKFVRRLMVIGVHYILGPHGPDTDLRRWGLKLCQRGGKNAKKRAVVAVARKLAVLLLAMLKNGQDYKPLRDSS